MYVLCEPRVADLVGVRVGGHVGYIYDMTRLLEQLFAAEVERQRQH